MKDNEILLKHLFATCTGHGIMPETFADYVNKFDNQELAAVLYQFMVAQNLVEEKSE